MCPEWLNLMPAHVSLSTSSNLLLRLKSRNGQAWDRFVGLYLPVVYRWLRELELQPADASDVSQIVFQTLSRRIALYSPDKAASGFRGWLWGVTRNAFLDHCRVQQRQPLARGGTSQIQRLEAFADAPQEPPSDSATFRSSLAHRALQVLKQDFETQTWTAFWRVVIDGQAADSVAEELFMTAGAVRQAKYRVLQRLREELAE